MINIKPKIKVNKGDIAIIALVSILSIIVFDFSTVQTVYAYSFTPYANNGSSSWVIASNSSYAEVLTYHGVVNSYAINALGTSLGTFSCSTCESIAEYNGNFYVATSTTLTKLGITTTGAPVSLGTVSISGPCLFTQQDVDSSSGQLLCTIPTSNTYKIVDLNTMTVTYTSTTLNTGGNPCSGPRIAVPDWSQNFVMISCNNSLVATYTIGTVTQLHNIVGGTNPAIVGIVGASPDKFLIVATSKLDLYSYTTSGGFVVVTSQIAVPNAAAIYVLGYDSVGKRFIVRSGATVSALDADNGSLLWSVSGSMTSSCGTTSNDVCLIDVVSNSQYLLSSGTNFIFSFDTSGLQAGTGGTAGSGSTTNTGGVDCTVPGNENILVCRLTNGHTGGSLGGVGGILDTGIFNTLKNSGLISGTDTNPKTNGVGLFITVIGFGVMTAMFFIASKGNISEIPTFVWFIASLALLGSLTAIQYIDPTFLIIGIIAIVALAVAKMNKTLFAGGGFAGGGFAGE